MQIKLEWLIIIFHIFIFFNPNFTFPYYADIIIYLIRAPFSIDNLDWSQAFNKYLILF